jgi:hypothetical protein
MKKLLLFVSAAALAALLAFAFAACGDDEPGLKIGDMGPGGGIIFLAEGGFYKECSGELGVHSWLDARTMAENHNGGGFSDWYLPDFGELSLMYENLHGKGRGGFSGDEYWSSTPGISSGTYNTLSFRSGRLNYRSWSNLNRTRAVRSFTIESNDPGTIGNAMLTIRNESGFDLTDVLWNNVSFANPGEDSIKPGTSVAMNVPDGSGGIRFKPKANLTAALRSQDLVTVGKDEQREFVLLNNTMVINENGGGSGTLASFSGVPEITIRQGSTVIAQHGEHDFGPVMTGTTRDITFTIENSGGVNLIIETVDGRRVNLDDNLSGVFSITQQPLGSTITPGSSATFTIRFAPTIRGSDFSADVQIKTSCHANAEFAFRVIGKTGVSQIAIRQGTAAIDQSGQYDFGILRTESTSDITFTIQNSGTENLTLESAVDSRVILDENLSGFFSISQQPLFAAIAPGSSAAFVMRFAPTAEGNNYAAIVRIKSDSHTHGEFAFGVIGRSDNTLYIIGDTGPGGGTIFFVSGGQYKEYSAELGSLNWSAANTAARAHRGGGFTSWRLPDSGEARQVVAHIGRDIAGAFLYWSSSPSFTGQYWAAAFPSYATTTPELYTQFTGSLLRTRAVREFTIH